MRRLIPRHSEVSFSEKGVGAAWTGWHRKPRSEAAPSQKDIVHSRLTGSWPLWAASQESLEEVDWLKWQKDVTAHTPYEVDVDIAPTADSIVS